MGQTTASGSGFVYDKQGHIITNDHVIEGHKIVDVKFADCSILKLLTLRLMFLFPIQSPQIVNNKG